MPVSNPTIMPVHVWSCRVRYPVDFDCSRCISCVDAGGRPVLVMLVAGGSRVFDLAGE